MYTNMMSFIAPIAIMSFVPGTVKAPVKPEVKDFKYVGDIPPLGFFDPLNYLLKIIVNIYVNLSYNMEELLC